MTSGPARLLIGLLGGGLLILAFPPWHAWWLAPVGVAGLIFGVRQRRLLGAVGVGWCAGLVFFAGHLPWMRVIGPDAWLLLAGLLGITWALVAVLIWCVRDLPGWPVWSAAAVIALEIARSVWPWGGFPWGSLAFSQADAPTLGWAWLLGSSGLGLAIALTGALLAWSAERPTVPRRWLTAATGIIVLTAGGAGLAVASAVLNPSVGQFATVIVQGNVPRPGLEFIGGPRQILGNHVDLTVELAAQIAGGGQPPVDVVIWPENSVDVDPFGDQRVIADVQRAADAIDRPVLIGSPLINPDDPRTLLNASLLWSPASAAAPGPAAAGQWYVKRRLVPFGEYIPHREALASLFERFKRIPRDFIVGSTPGIIEVPRAGAPPVVLGVVICFEVAYDDLVRDTVAAGGQVLVVQTNNATFSLAGQTGQQLAMGRVRAAEFGRWVLLAATSGVSAVIDSRGQVVEQSVEMTPDVLMATVPLHTALSPAVRFGAAMEWLIVGAALAAAVAAVIRRSGGRAPRRSRATAPAVR